MDKSEAVGFIRENHRAILVTRRDGGQLQTSPVLVTADDEGRVMISSRETAYKVKNLQDDPRATLCVFTDAFFGRWVQVDGTAEVITLPDAMELLVDYYRRVQGEHDDWDDYRAAMEREKRVIVRIAIDHAGPDVSG